jgi:hypothetical protein
MDGTGLGAEVTGIGSLLDWEETGKALGSWNTVWMTDAWVIDRTADCACVRAADGWEIHSVLSVIGACE